MFIKSILFAGLVTIGTLSAAVPAQAESFSFGVSGQNGGFYFESGNNGHRDKHYRRGGGHGQKQVYRGGGHGGERQYRGGHGGGHGGGKYFRGGGRGQGQWHGHRGRLTPFQVRQELRYRGFRQIHFFDRNGRIYRASALNRRGRPVGLAVNSWTGQIVNRWPLRRY